MAIPKKLFTKKWSDLSEKQKRNIGVSKAEFIRQKKEFNSANKNAATKADPPRPPTNTPPTKPKKAAILAINQDKGKLKPNDVEKISKQTGLQPKQIVKLATNSPKVEDKKVAKGATKLLDKKTNAESNPPTRPKKAAILAINEDKGKLTADNVEKIAEQTGLSPKKIVKIATNSPKVEGKKVAKGALSFLDKKPTNNNPDQDQDQDPYPYSTTDRDPDNPEDLGNQKRIEEDKEPGDTFGTSLPDEEGLIYSTYENKGGGILQIGNLPGHRVEDSPYADIKIIDYDASIDNYDPKKSLKGMKIFKQDSDELTFRTYKPKRMKDDEGEKITGDTFRTEKRKKDYAERGLKKGGGRITKFKIGGEYKKIKTDKSGNLKRLTLTKNGEYKPAKDKYPTSIKKKNTFSDILVKETGLKFKSGEKARETRLENISDSLNAKPAKFDEDKRNRYITQGKKSLKGQKNKNSNKTTEPLKMNYKTPDSYEFVGPIQT